MDTAIRITFLVFMVASVWWNIIAQKRFHGIDKRIDAQAARLRRILEFEGVKGTLEAMHEQGKP